MTRLLRTVRLGLRSLQLHLLRSSLTVLGMMFGVASVIAMLAVGEGASHEAQERIKALGSTNIIVRSVKPPANPQAGDQQQRVLRYGLRYEDAELIKKTVPDVDVMVPSRDYPKKFGFSTRVANGIARGTVPWYPRVAGLRMVKGTFFSDLHVRDASNVCVLSPQVAERLFLFEYPIGKTIKIGQDPFTVIGLIEQKTGVKRDDPSAESEANNDVIYIPLTSIRAYFGEQIRTRTSGSWKTEDVQLHEIHVQVADTKHVRPVAESLRTLLAYQHPKNDYDVIVPLELLREARATQKMFNIILGAIAGISLLVGGIGIMNIMLASVTERTREIGIRRALGAQKRHIVLQFLVETVVLSCLGGFMGIALGLLVPKIVTWVSNQLTIVKPEFMILSFGISAVVGVVFGIYPASRAANMDPIDALRHE